MAKNKRVIEMDFKKAEKQAKELEEIAQSLDSLAKNDMSDCLAGVANNWTGENAGEYIRKGNIVKGNIETVSKNLRSVAQTIREIAKETYDAEMRAVAIVKNVSST